MGRPLYDRQKEPVPRLRGYRLNVLNQTVESNIDEGSSLTDGDFTNAGIMTTNGSGVYSFTADNSTTWDAAAVTADATAALVQSGTGTPESVVTATVGTLFLRTDGGASTTLYVKESGAGNTGWIAK